MTNPVATFSNGHTDEYKGHRDIKAAWMIIHPDGQIDSGHSLDTDRATKTARNNARGCAGYNPYSARGAVPIGYAKAAHQYAVKKGFANIRELAADCARRKDEYEAQCTIEIVEVN